MVRKSVPSPTTTNRGKQLFVSEPGEVEVNGLPSYPRSSATLDERKQETETVVEWSGGGTSAQTGEKMSAINSNVCQPLSGNGDR